jgi:hypothetical protein
MGPFFRIGVAFADIYPVYDGQKGSYGVSIQSLLQEWGSQWVPSSGLGVV